MVALKDNFPRFIPEEYFALEEQQLERHEYIDGEVYAMSGGTQNHSDIAGNFLTLVKSHIRGGGCKTFNSDLRIKIIEVLSPITEAYDRGNKFKLYRKNPSLRDYALVDSSKMAIDLYRKDESGNWYIGSDSG